MLSVIVWLWYKDVDKADHDDHDDHNDDHVDHNDDHDDDMRQCIDLKTHVLLHCVNSRVTWWWWWWELWCWQWGSLWWCCWRWWCWRWGWWWWWFFDDNDDDDENCDNDDVGDEDVQFDCDGDVFDAEDEIPASALCMSCLSTWVWDEIPPVCSFQKSTRTSSFPSASHDNPWSSSSSLFLWLSRLSSGLS